MKVLQKKNFLYINTKNDTKSCSSDKGNIILPGSGVRTYSNQILHNKCHCPNEEENGEVIPNELENKETNLKTTNKSTKTSINSPTSALIPCVIIDYIQDTIKRCGSIYKLRTPRNLYGT